MQDSTVCASPGLRAIHAARSGSSLHVTRSLPRARLRQSSMTKVIAKPTQPPMTPTKIYFSACVMLADFPCARLRLAPIAEECGGAMRGALLDIAARSHRDDHAAKSPRNNDS